MNQDPIDRPGAAQAEATPASGADEQNPETGSVPPGVPDTDVETGQPGDQRPAPEPDSGAQDPAALETEIAALRATVGSHWDKVLRMNAEMENLRKRTERDLENAHRYALERFVAELLPVKDSMELGLSAALDGHHELAGIREGYELTLKMFSSALEKFAVEEINPLGEPFDPELHQAMTAQPAEGVEPGTVIEVVQKGYRLNQRLVRPAMVIVSK